MMFSHIRDSSSSRRAGATARLAGRGSTSRQGAAAAAGVGSFFTQLLLLQKQLNHIAQSGANAGVGVLAAVVHSTSTQLVRQADTSTIGDISSGGSSVSARRLLRGTRTTVKKMKQQEVVNKNNPKTRTLTADETKTTSMSQGEDEHEKETTFLLLEQETKRAHVGRIKNMKQQVQEQEFLASATAAHKRKDDDDDDDDSDDDDEAATDGATSEASATTSSNTSYLYCPDPIFYCVRWKTGVGAEEVQAFEDVVQKVEDTFKNRKLYWIDARRQMPGTTEADNRCLDEGRQLFEHECCTSTGDRVTGDDNPTCAAAFATWDQIFQPDQCGARSLFMQEESTDFCDSYGKERAALFEMVLNSQMYLEKENYADVELELLNMNEQSFTCVVKPEITEDESLFAKQNPFVGFHEAAGGSDINNYEGMQWGDVLTVGSTSTGKAPTEKAEWCRPSDRDKYLAAAAVQKAAAAFGAEEEPDQEENDAEVIMKLDEKELPEKVGGKTPCSVFYDETDETTSWAENCTAEESAGTRFQRQNCMEKCTSGASTEEQEDEDSDSDSPPPGPPDAAAGLLPSSATVPIVGGPTPCSVFFDGSEETSWAQGCTAFESAGTEDQMQNCMDKCGGATEQEHRDPIVGGP
ncbi:unnamed protein product, partial [Amoebophrya sp. A120]|eukprot:GSA120T00009725001.1